MSFKQYLLAKRTIFWLYNNFSNFSALSWREQVNFQLNDDEVRFVLDQDTELDFFSASLLKQQSADGHVCPLRKIILIQSQAVFASSPQWATLAEKQ